MARMKKPVATALKAVAGINHLSLITRSKEQFVRKRNS
jgi:hypothetical protein